MITWTELSRTTPPRVEMSELACGYLLGCMNGKKGFVNYFAFLLSICVYISLLCSICLPFSTILAEGSTENRCRMIFLRGMAQAPRPKSSLWPSPTSSLSLLCLSLLALPASESDRSEVLLEDHSLFLPLPLPLICNVCCCVTKKLINNFLTYS